MSHALEVTDATFQDEVLAADGTVLVEFWAEWCGPCRAVSPILEAIADDNPDKLRLVKVNADDNPQAALRYQITSIPAMRVFRAGEVVRMISGAKPRPALEHDLAEFLA
jgi:thioredoxin 1